jgi:hypothetical protein
MMAIRILLGLAIGVIGEWGTVKYTQAIIRYRPAQAALTTLGLGLLNLFIIGALAWNHYIDMAVADIIGEAILVYSLISHDKKKRKSG